MPRDEFLTHGVTVYIARSSDLIFVCLRWCVCNSRYQSAGICATSVSSGGVCYLFKNNLVLRRRSGTRLLYLPSSCLISCYYVRVPTSHVVSMRAKGIFSPAFSPILLPPFVRLLPLLFPLSVPTYLSSLTASSPPRSSFSSERDYYFRLKCPPFQPDRVWRNIVKSIPKCPRLSLFSSFSLVWSFARKV